MKEGSGNGASLMKLILDSFFESRLFWEPESGGQSGIAVKDQDSHNLASEFWARKVCFKA